MDNNGHQTISACMIVKNEVHTLPDCLRTILGYVDELVIVDTGSTDGTQALIDTWAEYANKGTKIVRGEYQWHDDFSAARNYAMTLTTGDWIFTIDADDRVAVDDWATMKNLMAKAPEDLGDFDVIACQVINIYKEKGYEDGVFRGMLIQQRFFKSKSNMEYVGAWHNQPSWPHLNRPVNLIRTSFRIMHTGYGMITADKLKEKHERLLRMGQKAVEDHPDKASVWRNLAKAYWGCYVISGKDITDRNQEYMTNLHEACDRAASITNTAQSHIFAEVMFLKGQAYYSMAKYIEAEECLAAAIKEHPRYIDAILFRGYCCADNQNLSAAQYWLRRYLIEQERLSQLESHSLITYEYANEVARVHETLAAIAHHLNRERYNMGVILAPAMKG